MNRHYEVPTSFYIDIINYRPAKLKKEETEEETESQPENETDNSTAAEVHSPAEPETETYLDRPVEKTERATYGVSTLLCTKLFVVNHTLCVKYFNCLYFTYQN